MMNYPEIAIISAAVQAYIESEGTMAPAENGVTLSILIAAAVTAYTGMETTAV